MHSNRLCRYDDFSPVERKVSAIFAILPHRAFQSRVLVLRNSAIPTVHGWTSPVRQRPSPISFSNDTRSSKSNTVVMQHNARSTNHPFDKKLRRIRTPRPHPAEPFGYGHRHQTPALLFNLVHPLVPVPVPVPLPLSPPLVLLLLSSPNTARSSSAIVIAVTTLRASS